MLKKIEGVIKHWNYDKGYGFIEVGDYPEVTDYFAHISYCDNFEPEKGDCVTFVPIVDKTRGNIVASQIKSTGESINLEYFDREKRRNTTKEIALEKENQWRERRENSDSFKEQFFWERKEGYHCRLCHRYMDYKTMDCACKLDNSY